MSWTLIEHQALTSSAASVTLGSGGTIPQTYKTLKLVISARCDGSQAQGWQDCYVTINGNTSNLTGRRLFGTGSTAGSAADTAFYYINNNNSTSSTFSNVELTFPNYAGSTNKPFSSDSVQENNGTNGLQLLAAGLWSSTSAITSIATNPGNGSFLSGSTFTLYGLA